eukprot:9871875-Karenia_brevis.AAC.1
MIFLYKADGQGVAHQEFMKPDDNTSNSGGDNNDHGPQGPRPGPSISTSSTQTPAGAQPQS